LFDREGTERTGDREKEEEKGAEGFLCKGGAVHR